MKIFNWSGGFALMILMLGACVEPYDPPVDDTDVNFLVVDAFLNATDGIATVALTRTLPVKSSEEIPGESAATIRIEDENGFFYPLLEVDQGVYRGPVANAGAQSRYRLLIRTQDNHEYSSDFIEIVNSPPIDSITWSITKDGVEFKANTHDPTGSSRNYRWKYTETYEYRSAFNSLYMFSPEGIVSREPDRSIHICWRSNVSTDIILGSTQHLNEAVASQVPVTFIPFGSLKLSVRYSLYLQQQALTADAYDYWLNLERSTEHRGGLFDPLPSEVGGNIVSTTHPAEKVIGFFSGSTVSEKRIFLSRFELPREIIAYFRSNLHCELDTLSLDELPAYPPSTLLVDALTVPGAGIIGYTTSTRSCIDCTSFGGTTDRPAFWE